MKYTHIIFDWDNCLAKTGQHWHQALDTVAVMHNITYTKAENKKALTDLIRYEINPFGKKHDTGKLWNELSAVVQELNKSVDLYENAIETLQQLSDEGLMLAVVSSSEQGPLHTGLNTHELMPFFDIVVSVDDVANKKPDPEGIQKVLAHFDIDGSTAIKIGDKGTDVLAAQGAGIDSALFVPPLNEKIYGTQIDEFRKTNPTYQISDLGELVEIAKNGIR